MKRDAAKGSILIVDDSLDNVQPLSQMLTAHGHSVRKATSGREALDLIVAARPELILLDIGLKDMSAYDVCARIKADASTSSIPVVFMGGLEASEEPIRSFGVGGADYIRRPYQIAELLARVRNHLENSRMRGELEASQRIAGVGTYVLDIPGARWTSSPVLDEIFGIDANFERSVEGWISIIHPEWRGTMLQYLTKDVVGKGASFDKEYKIVRPHDAMERWVHGLGHIELGSDAQPVRMLGTITDITKRKQVELENEKLLAAVEVERTRLSGLIHSISDEVWFADVERKFTIANPAALKNFCIDTDQSVEVEKLAASLVVLRADGSARPVEDAPPLRALRGEVVHNDEEIVQVPATGELRHRQVNSTPVRDSVGKIIGSVSVVRDITEMKRAERSLREVSARQEAILNAVSDIIMEVDSNKMYAWANRSGIQFFGDDVIGKEAAYYFEGEQDTYSRVQPIFEGGEEIIFLESWQRRKDGQKRLLEWRCSVLKDDKGNATGAISSARDITEMRAAEVALVESEERFRNVFEHSAVGKSITSLDGGIKVNGAFCEMVGYSEEEMKSIRWQQLTHPDDVKRDEDIIKSMIDGERDWARWQKRYIRRDGRVVWVDISTRLQRNAAGKPLYFISTALDMTERKQSEEAIRNSESFLNHLIEQSPVAMWIADDRGTLLRLNRACQTLLNITSEEVVGKYNIFNDNIVRDQGFLDLVKGVFERGDVAHFEISYDSALVESLTLHQTVKVFLEVTIFPIKDIHGRITNAVIQHKDITDRKRAETALKESEVIKSDLLEKLKEAESIALIGSWEWNVQTNVVWWSDETYKLFGVKQEEFVPSFEANAKFIHPDDLENYRLSFEHSLKTGDSLNLEVRLVSQRGAIKHCQAKAKIISDASGQPLRFIGTILDISDRIQAEASVRASEQQLKSYIDNAGDALYVLEVATGRIRNCNARACRDLGYSREELLELSTTDIEHELTSKEVETIHHDLEPESVTTIEGVHMRKDGTLFPVEIRLTSLALEQPGLMLAISRDITDRKRAEAERTLNSRRTQALLQLNQMADASLPEITNFALEEVVHLTQSTIGYLAFLNEDETVLTMHSWSKSAMAECAILDKPIVYPVVSTGLWGEAVRQRRPVITNDYAAVNPLKKGCPLGHVAIRRHMNVPVFAGSRIVIVAGVGNKIDKYDSDDVHQLTLLMESMWRIIERKRAEEALRLKNFVFDVSIAANSISDINGNIKEVNNAFLQVWGYQTRDEVLGRSIAEFLNSPEEAGAIVLALNNAGHWEGDYIAKRADSSTFVAHGLATTMMDESGTVTGYQSAVLDITERKRAEENNLSQLQELRRWQEVTLGREDRILALKQEVNEILGRIGEPVRYVSVQTDAPNDAADKVS